MTSPIAPVSPASSARVDARARRLLVSRGLRGGIDGAVSVILARYLANLGLEPLAVGTIVTGTLLGSGATTLLVGFFAHRLSNRTALCLAAGAMVATGLGFAFATGFWALLAIAVLGTVNPSSGDVSVFLPLEQAALAGLAQGRSALTALFARYNVTGSLAGAFGALLVVVPDQLARRYGIESVDAERSLFLVYAAIGVVVAWLYRKYRESAAVGRAPRPLATSRAAVLKLAALFSLDSFGGGFVVQSLLALWLFRRFELSLSAAGAFFFAASSLSSVSQFLSPRLAARIGLVRTMVYTHVPANLLLMAAAFMPTLSLALVCLLLRASVSSMDVPARQAYVMSVVPPEERAAAASFTNVPRSLASSLAPALAGFLLGQTAFGWPLLCAGGIKLGYDVLLLLLLRKSELELRLPA